MVREFSAGGVVVRRKAGSWWIAVIEPDHREDPTAKSVTKRVRKVTLCLPKGALDPGEKPPEAALREVREETGITAKTGDKARRQQVRLCPQLGRRRARLQNR